MHLRALAKLQRLETKLQQTKNQPLFTDYYAYITAQEVSRFPTLWQPAFYKIRDIPEFEANFPPASKFFILAPPKKLTLSGKLPFRWQSGKQGDSLLGKVTLFSWNDKKNLLFIK